jgi:Tol biopolymer transport system component
VVGPEGVVALGRGEAPAWRPDGRFIAFMVTEDDGYRVTGSDLHVATPDGAVRFVLATTPDVHELYPAWTPDGRALLYDDARTQRVMRLPLAEAR